MRIEDPLISEVIRCTKSIRYKMIKSSDNGKMEGNSSEVFLPLGDGFSKEPLSKDSEDSVEKDVLNLKESSSPVKPSSVVFEEDCMEIGNSAVKFPQPQPLVRIRPRLNTSEGNENQDLMSLL